MPESDIDISGLVSAGSVEVMVLMMSGGFCLSATCLRRVRRLPVTADFLDAAFARVVLSAFTGDIVLRLAQTIHVKNAAQDNAAFALVPVRA